MVVIGSKFNGILSRIGLGARAPFVSMVIVSILVVAGCQTGEAEIPTQAVRLTQTNIAIVTERQIVAQASPSDTSVPTPSITPSSSPLPPTVTATPSPTITLVPTNTKRPRPTATLTPSIAAVLISTNPPGQFGGDETATWTPPPPPTPQVEDHYFFKRPFDSQYNTYWARSYSYGSTDNNTRPVHHGLDFPNPSGVPILAVAAGTIYYAGDDVTSAQFGPQQNFYGNVIVIEHYFLDADGQKVYTLYGHLSKIEVQTGQKIKVGQEIGLVGSEGVALGAHLHLEVRIGSPTDYGATRNPELWVASYPNTGVLAGRVTDLNGNLLYGVQVQVQATSGAQSYGYSYADDSLKADSFFGENYTIPDLSEGFYNVYIRPSPTSAVKFKKIIYVWPGRTNWLNIHISP